jgi:Zn-dependent protease
MGNIDIYGIVQQIALIAPGFLLAITVHELAHGYIAYKFGDPTAKLAGRLTFNPISHLDPVGTIMLIVTQVAGMGIGWAKPVPVDSRYLKNPRADMLWISLGGPAANLISAAILAVLVHLMRFMIVGRPIGGGLAFVLEPLFWILIYGVRINVILAIFNLIPVPPLDGSKILAGLLPRRQAYEFEKLERYGLIILVVLLFTNAFGYILTPPFRFIMSLLLGGL